MKKVKQKYQWLIGAIALFVIGVGTGYIKMPGLVGGTGVAPIEVTDVKPTLTGICYDQDNGIDNGKVMADININNEANEPISTSNADADGTLSLDDTKGLKVGQTVTVRCQNNTDDGYYENKVTATLKTGANVIGVPMKHVGDVAVTLTSASITMGANDMEAVEYDLNTDALREYFYKPIVACKDYNSSDQVIATGEVTAMTGTGGALVGCDVDAITGYNFCWQLDKEFVGTSDVVENAKLWFQSGSTNPAGYIQCAVYDGVPYGSAGIASINRANAYDSDNTAFTVITVA